MSKDYLYSIPVISTLVNDRTREANLAELKRAGADRVMLAIGTCTHENMPTYLKSLESNIPYFREHGYEVGVWINSCGHGGPLAGEDPNAAVKDRYTLITDVDGRTQHDTYCVTDPEFISDMAGYVSEIAKLGPDMIMLDDDLRLDVRSIGVCCSCDRHMALIKKLLGREINREELKKELADPMPNRTRDAFLKANADSMNSFAEKLREAVNAVAPGVRLGYCAAPLSFDQEGYSAEELTYNFAGDTKPFLRLSAAPYWAKDEVKRLPETIEKSRQQAAWLRHEGHGDIEIFAEGDCYPRPRVNCPSSYLECFDQGILADPNIDGILKYMVDYSMSVRYEHGYIDRHVKDAALRDAIAKAFRTRRSVGVYNFVTHRYTAEQHRPYDGAAIKWRENASTRFLLAQSLPITYEFTRSAIDTSPVLVSVFGEDARFIGADVLFSSSGRSGTFIIDASAAMILSDRGVDVGFVSAKKAETPRAETSADSGERVAIYGNAGDFYAFELKDGAKALTMYDRKYPGSYVYVNGRGARFIVYAFDASHDLAADRGLLYFSYERQRLLCKAVNEGDVKIPAYVPESLNLYLRTSEGDDGSLAVGMWNLWPDTVYSPQVILGSEYGSIEFIAGEGKLEGDKVMLDSDIIPFGFAGFIVRK